jgi:hypothetical protein
MSWLMRYHYFLPAVEGFVKWSPNPCSTSYLLYNSGSPGMPGMLMWGNDLISTENNRGASDAFNHVMIGCVVAYYNLPVG